MSSADGDETFLYRERGDVREFVKSVWRKALEERPELGGSLAHQSSFDHEALSLCLCLWGFDFEEERTHLKFREGGLACYLPAKLAVGLVDQLDGDDREALLLRLLENSRSRILSRNPSSRRFDTVGQALFTRVEGHADRGKAWETSG